MTTDPKPLPSYTNHELASLCTRQSSLVDSNDIEPDACYELFSRACVPPFDDIAWQAMYDPYTKLVQHWLGQYASEDTLQETNFLRFFQAEKNPPAPFATRYTYISAVMAYLKRCAIAARIAAWHADERHQIVEIGSFEVFMASPIGRDNASTDEARAYATFKALVYSKLKDDVERLVFEWWTTPGTWG